MSPKSTADPAPLKLGAHMSIAGGYDRAVRAAGAVGFQTVQLFTKNNNQWKGAAITDAHVAAFRAALDETGVVDPVSHASYLINLAAPGDELYAKSVAALADELTRSWVGQWPQLPDAMTEAAGYVAPTTVQLAGLTVPMGVTSASDDPIHPLEVGVEWVAAAPYASLRTVALADIGTDPGTLGTACLDALNDL